MRMEDRPRRRLFDGVDAGYRLFSALFDLSIWGFVLAVMATSEIRSSAWFWMAAALGVPLAAKLVFAGWTVRAWLRERDWLRAQQQARQAGEHSTAPVRPPRRDER